jgi:FKBP-type peptidyl-prolyl cis-trans isomerase
VIVTPDVGYGDKGIDEIPGGATIELQIELLEA